MYAWGWERLYVCLWRRQGLRVSYLGGVRVIMMSVSAIYLLLPQAQKISERVSSAP
jgi:hypothetical protein